MRHHPPRFGQIHIPHRVLGILHLLSTIAGLVAAASLWLDQRYDWFEHSPGGDAFEVNEQPYFIVIFALGAILAFRFQLLGGTIATFTAAALIVFANRQLAIYDAVSVSLVFLVPGLLWLTVGIFELRDERFHRSPEEHPRPLILRRDLLAGIVVIGAAATAGVRVGRYLFDRLYGPTHPASNIAPPSASAVRWSWSGAVTASSAAFTTRLKDDDEKDVELLITSLDSFDGVRSIPARSDDEGFVRVDVDGLEPDTMYRYVWVVDGMRSEEQSGQTRTLSEGPHSFSLLVGGCARTGSNGAVFDAIRSHNPAMVILNGDLHYADITRDDQQAFRQILDHTLSRPAQAEMFRTLPVAYTWDDHDYGGLDAHSDSRPAASAEYRRYCPHYPLASTTSTLHQAFSIGRVRVLLTDVRSGRLPGDDDEDDEVGTMLGQEQKRWLMEELLSARDDHALTLWVNPVPWISTPSEEGDADDWSGFPAERTEIANFIADHDLAGSLVMAAGDAHMVAIDDGTNSDYSNERTAGFPILHCAALDRPGSLKGGPYSHGAFPGGGQFGMIDVTDDGDQMTVELSGRNWRDDVVVRYSFAVSA